MKSTITKAAPNKSLPAVALTESEYSLAVQAGEASEPRAQSIRYDRATARLVIELNNGVALMIPTAALQGLNGASAKEIAAVEILADGYAVHWPALDADFVVPELVSGLFGTRKWMEEMQAQAASQFLAQAGRKGGSASTHAKSAASRINGKLGGRPRKAAKARREPAAA